MHRLAYFLTFELLTFKISLNLPLASMSGIPSIPTGAVYRNREMGARLDSPTARTEGKTILLVHRERGF